MSDHLFARAVSSQSLTQSEAEELMGLMMSGDMSAVRMAAVLSALRVRGETTAEIAGLARGMRTKAVRVPVAPGLVLDTCGTGGTNVQTFNISTAAAFVVAAVGVRVAKHGNRSASRQSGSADVLEALGLKLEITAERLAEAVDSIGIAFLFARSHHPAMRHVVPVRAEMGIRTVFNVLGPLTNPAGATHQLLGVAEAQLVPIMAGALRELGTTAAMVVHGVGGDAAGAGSRYDDVSVAGPTTVAELRDGQLREYTLEPSDLGVTQHDAAALLGSDPASNAKIVRDVLGGGGTDAQRDAVAANAGAALYIAGKVSDLKSGVGQAIDVLRSGAALEKLEALVRFTNRD
jgi:anthranilate phosphoribosyltransferase